MVGNIFPQITRSMYFYYPPSMYAKLKASYYTILMIILVIHNIAAFNNSLNFKNFLKRWINIVLDMDKCKYRLKVNNFF